MKYVVVWLILVHPLHLMADELLQVDLKVSPKDSVLVKQAMTINLEILTVNWFSSEPKINLPEQDEFVFLETPISKGPISKTEAGKTLSGILVEYVAYPVSVGAFELESIVIEAAVANPEGAVHKMQWQSDPIEINAKLPEGVKNLDHMIMAEKVDVKEEWRQQTGDPQVGDSLVRVVIIEAEGTQSMLIPESSWAQIDGASIYPQKPTLSDQSNRGTMKALHRQEIQYTLEKEGKIRVPAQKWHWFNVSENTVEQAVLLEKTINVKASQAFSSGSSSKRSARSITINSVMGAFLAVVFLGFIAKKIWPRLQSYCDESRKLYKRSARYKYKQLLKCIDHEAPTIILDDVYRWLNSCSKSVVAMVKESEIWIQLQEAALAKSDLNREQLKNIITQAYLIQQKIQVEINTDLKPLNP